MRDDTSDHSQPESAEPASAEPASAPASEPEPEPDWPDVTLTEVRNVVFAPLRRRNSDVFRFKKKSD